MIVDLLRNDLGKISQTGSVKVAKLFAVEKYKTLLQMTSTIESKLKSKISFWDFFSSLFPSGSVTGAPKIRTMEIIKDLEKEPRKIYTGAIGYFSPKHDAVFNVAIRTLLIENARGEMGIGSGITYSSHPLDEFKECKLKAQFLTRPAFQLIETMLLKGGRIFLLELHLARLKRSAEFFGFYYKKNIISSRLRETIKKLSGKSAYRLRLLLDANGHVSIETAPLPLLPESGIKHKICVSAHRINPNNVFLYHKTTNRNLYDLEYKKYKALGYYDVIFTNNKNEVTEGAISNIILQKKGIFYTPPIASGILPGVFREYFIKKHPHKIKQTKIKMSDLKTADNLFCMNSVRGLVKVSLVQGSEIDKMRTRKNKISGS